jgi:hypothetical protein
MAKTTQPARERIGHALYMLEAGSDPELFLEVLRAYVLQHIETTEQAVELLRNLAAVNPPAFAESLQVLAAHQSKRRGAIERLSDEIQGNLAELVRGQGSEANRPVAKAPSKKKTSAVVRER